MRYSKSMLALIGNTPLLKLSKVTKGIEANVFVKLELFNPSGNKKGESRAGDICNLGEVYFFLTYCS